MFHFWSDFSDALFLYFGRVLGYRFMTQKHVLPLGCNFLNDFSGKGVMFECVHLCFKWVYLNSGIEYSMKG